MTTKDWIYLGLIVLAAVAFYCNGFYAGVMRSRKLYENLLNDATEEAKEALAEDERNVATCENTVGDVRFAFRQMRPEVPKRGQRDDFGNN